MSSSQASADAVRASVTSTSTCTPATTTLLTDLLIPKVNVSEHPKPKPPAKPTSETKGRAKRKGVSPVAKPKGKKVGFADQESKHGNGEQLSAKERSILATEVINATLKALSEAIKAPAPRRKAPADLVKSSARKGLRRSNSMPMTPLQPRSLNRVSSSPDIANRHSRSNSSVSLTSSGHRSAADCARVAFACLRNLQAARAPGLDLPPLQIETGMSALIGKLVNLGLDDLAVKEIKILKRRLDPDSKPNKAGTAATAPQTLDELLDFGKGGFTEARLGLIITTQLQVLRLLASSKRCRQIEAALPFLQLSYPSSPSALLLQAAKKSSKPDKIARQLQSLSEILLSLSPSVSPADDAIALEPMLSIRPESAFQLQLLALRIRAMWWKVAGHKGNTTKDLSDPFLRCLSSLARRSQCSPQDTYHLACKAVDQIQTALSDVASTSLGPKQVLTGIFRILGSLAGEGKLIDDAIKWTREIYNSYDVRSDTAAKRTSVTARLVALVLRRSARQPEDEELLLELLDGLDKPFKGESSEIDELLTDVSSMRRATITLLAKCVSDTEEHHELMKGIRDMCESLVFMCPKLCLRYLGAPLDSNAVAKDSIRYEQRRYFITKISHNAIDSVLFLVRQCLSKESSTWKLMDSKLQDCVLLLGRLDSGNESECAEDKNSAPSYYVKISNLYYSKYLDMRKDLLDLKDLQPLRVLRRSIDCVRNRPVHEKKAAMFSSKLERMAEVCQKSKRHDDLWTYLLLLQGEIIESGALSAVTEAANIMPFQAAWNVSEKSSALARTMKSLIQVQVRYLPSAQQSSLFQGEWSRDERATMLEQYLDILFSINTASDATLGFQIQLFRELLGLYPRKDYPIRRLRLLVRLLSLDSDSQQEVIVDVSSELDAFRLKDIIFDSSKDCGLQYYWLHHRTLANSLLELQEPSPNVDNIKQNLIVWSSIRKDCTLLRDLESRIENVSGLLTHLQSIADYLQVKGRETIRLATLRLIADFYELCNIFPDTLILSFARLGEQWLQLGYSGKAGLALDRAQAYSHENGIQKSTLLQLHLSYAEYLLAIGNHSKCEEHIAQAQSIYSAEQESGLKLTPSLEQKTVAKVLVSRAYLMHSMLALERGSPQVALTFAKQGVRVLRQAWASLESYQSRQYSRAGVPLPQTAPETITDDISNLSSFTIKVEPSSDTTSGSSGPMFWPLVAPLFRAITYLSSLHAHHGLFLETVYYAEQAHAVVQGIGSEIHTAMSSASLGSIWARGGNLHKASEFLKTADLSGIYDFSTREKAILSYHSGHLHSMLKESKTAIKFYEEAETTLRVLIGTEFIDRLDWLVDPADDLQQKLASLTVSKKKVPAPRKTATRSKAAAKSQATTTTKTAVEPPLSVSDECSLFLPLRGKVLRKKVECYNKVENHFAAVNHLAEAELCSSTQCSVIEQSIAMAKQLLVQSMEQMHADPVYAVLKDSTISFPAVAGQSKSDRLSELSVAKLSSPPQKTAPSKDRRDINRSKSPNPDSFFDKLRQAQARLTEVYPLALSIAPTALVHSVTALMNTLAILLSAAGQIKGKSLAHPGFASCSVEIARSLIMRRERRAILTQSAKNDISWPTLGSADHRRSSMGPPHDLAHFQKNYIDIIPPVWTAVSIALSDSHDELSITKFETGHSPFVLRLPLGRSEAISGSGDTFTFKQGHTKLLEIIEAANESSHQARTTVGREAKEAWWEARRDLDEDMKTLLENIERVWLCGFTGIFSQHTRRPELLARFQKSFSNILDRHLPSRRKTKRAASPRINLDWRILELFIGLGDVTAETVDTEQLDDLLYFVVDVLQFHGELNAIDEIDFDAIGSDTTDALAAYHVAALGSSYPSDEGRHTILILDKALHAFPWESLPCMSDLAVSRLPSLSCLRDRILEQQPSMPENAASGRYVSRDNGAYILNPEGDLTATQARFTPSLQTLPSWDSITARAPSEAEMRDHLAEKDIMLYFGHGSGAQFIRSREIRRLEKCAVTLLMGCSSGALTEAGEFEPYGPPVNYMHAGAPALVGMLWDVTDKDIDRFFLSTFEQWGLFETGGEKKGKGKGKKKVNVNNEEEKEGREKKSLVEAVVGSRDQCIFRYLNAAAVVVYGIPVYIK